MGPANAVAGRTADPAATRITAAGGAAPAARAARSRMETLIAKGRRIVRRAKEYRDMVIFGKAWRAACRGTMY